jgi:hypothetical protein
MGRIKVSTILDEHLFRRAKLESVRRRKALSEILGEALERYLNETGRPSSSSSVVAESWGVLSVEKQVLDEVLADEAGLFDS